VITTFSGEAQYFTETSLQFPVIACFYSHQFVSQVLQSKLEGLDVFLNSAFHV